MKEILKLNLIQKGYFSLIFQYIVFNLRMRKF